MRYNFKLAQAKKNAGKICTTDEITGIRLLTPEICFDYHSQRWHILYNTHSFLKLAKKCRIYSCYTVKLDSVMPNKGHLKASPDKDAYYTTS